MGIGGSPEAVLAAAGIKCLGGDMQCKMWPRDANEREALVEAGWEKDLDRVFAADDLANGKNIIFCATGISDSALLRGVKAKEGGDRRDLFNSDAREKQNGALYPNRPQSADKDDSAALRPARASYILVSARRHL